MLQLFFNDRPSGRPPRSLITALTLTFLAAGLGAQTTEETSIERRIQVVFTDEEGAGEERIWIDRRDETDPLVLTEGDGEVRIHAAPRLHPRSYLGVHLLDITPELRAHFGAPGAAGTLVSGVAEGGPAAAAGVAVGDVLTSIDGAEVAHSGQVLRRLAGREEGETITLGLVRDRRTVVVVATLAARPRQQVDLAPMFGLPADGERRVLRLPTRILEIEGGDLDEAFSELHRRLESPEWRRMLEETNSRRGDLENRIHELEERLLEMERRLAEGPE